MAVRDDGSAPWQAADKGDHFPGYVCQSKCAKGYQWHPDVSKCLMVVNQYTPK